VRRPWIVYEAGKPLEWAWGETYSLGCCDCGLVHKFSIRKVRGGIEVEVKRDNRATAQFRRHRTYPFWHKPAALAKEKP